MVRNQLLRQQTRQVIPCLLALSFACACTTATITRLKSGSDDVPSLKERVVGSIRFVDEVEGVTHSVNVVKIHKGYALKGNVLNGETSSTNMVLSKDNEKDWFAGVQLKWAF